MPHTWIILKMEITCASRIRQPSPMRPENSKVNFSKFYACHRWLGKVFLRRNPIAPLETENITCAISVARETVTMFLSFSVLFTSFLLPCEMIDSFTRNKVITYCFLYRITRRDMLLQISLRDPRFKANFESTYIQLVSLLQSTSSQWERIHLQRWKMEILYCLHLMVSQFSRIGWSSFSSYYYKSCNGFIVNALAWWTERTGLGISHLKSRFSVAKEQVSESFLSRVRWKVDVFNIIIDDRLLLVVH